MATHSHSKDVSITSGAALQQSSQFRFNAFISYSRNDADTPVAAAIHRALLRFAKPLLTRRALRVFRDSANMTASPDLWAEIETALKQSEYFILLASPHAKNSKGVAKEVEAWCHLQRQGRLIIMLAEGEIAWDENRSDFDWESTTALPELLRGQFSAQPLWVDLRSKEVQRDLSLDNPSFQDVVAYLAAPLHHRPKDELIGEDLAILRRGRRVRLTAIVALTFLTLVAIIAALLAINQRQIALKQRDRAKEQASIATAGFLAGKAIDIRQREPDLSLLLSAEAYSRADTEDTRNALLTALQNARFIKSYLLGHSNDVSGVDLNHDASLLASVQRTTGKKLIVWDVETLLPHFTYVEKENEAESDKSAGWSLIAAIGYERVAFSPDRFSNIFAWDSRSVDIFSSIEKELITNHPYSGAIAYLPNKKRLAWVNGEYIVYQDDFRSRRVHMLEGKDINRLFFTHDENFLIGTTMTEIRVWDLSSESVAWKAHTGMTKIEGVDVSYDGRLIAAVGRDGKRQGASLMVWDFMTDVPVYARDITPQEGLLKDVAFWPGQDALLTAGGGGSTGGHSISIWRASTGEHMGPLLVGFEHPTQALAFSPDGRLLASAGRDGKVLLWDFSNRPHLGHFLHVTDEAASALVAHPHLSVIALGYTDGNVILYDYDRDAISMSFAVGKPIVALAYGPTGANLYIGARDGTVARWDVASSSEAIPRVEVSVGERLHSLQLNASGSRVLAVVPPNELIVLEPDLLQPAGPVMFHQESFPFAVSAAFHPTKPLLFSRGTNDLNVWHLDDHRLLGRYLVGGEVPAASILSRPDGQQLAYVESYQINLLDQEDFEAIQAQTISDGGFGSIDKGAPLKGHKEPINAVAYSPDGRILATASTTWNTPSKALWRSGDALYHLLRGVVSGDPPVQSPNNYQTIFLWNSATHSPIGRPLILEGAFVTHLAFGHDGKALISLSYDGKLVAWDVDPESWAKRARRIANRELSAAEVATYLQAGP